MVLDRVAPGDAHGAHGQPAAARAGDGSHSRVRMALRLGGSGTGRTGSTGRPNRSPPSSRRPLERDPSGRPAEVMAAASPYGRLTAASGNRPGGLLVGWRDDFSLLDHDVRRGLVPRLRPHQVAARRARHPLHVVDLMTDPDAADAHARSQVARTSPWSSTRFDAPRRALECRRRGEAARAGAHTRRRPAH